MILVSRMIMPWGTRTFGLWYMWLNYGLLLVVAFGSWRGSKPLDPPRYTGFWAYGGAVLGLALEFLLRQASPPWFTQHPPMAMYFSMLILAPVFEETVYKRVLIGGAVRAGIKPVWAVIGQAFLFWILHVLVLGDGTLGHFFLALTTGLLYMGGTGLLTCVVVHSAANGLIIASSFVRWSLAEHHV